MLDILVQRRRDKRAAKKFFRKLLKGLTYVPRVIVTDKLKSYGAAKRELLPGVANIASTAISIIAPRTRISRRVSGSGVCNGSNHRARRSVSSSAYGPILQHFRPRRHRFSAPAYRQKMENRFHSWQEITVTGLAA